MRHPELQYLELAQHILKNGDERMDRTGVGTRSIFGATMRFDLSDGTMPILTTKKVFWKTAIKEMLWFLKGETNLLGLLQNNVKIWTDWPLQRYRELNKNNISQEVFEARILADPEFARQWGDLGPVYGKQWRRWQGPHGEEHDQIADLIEKLRHNPADRRMLFHGWNVPELGQMALPPCHLLYQYHVTSTGKLNSLMYQRSVDVLLGLPFNIVGAVALQHMLADQAGLELGEFVWMGGDTHIYMNHMDQIEEQLSRDPRPLPTLTLASGAKNINDYKIDDFVVTGYDPHDAIAAPVAV
jgi:thymidylate synthase